MMGNGKYVFLNNYAHQLVTAKVCLRVTMAFNEASDVVEGSDLF